MAVVCVFICKSTCWACHLLLQVSAAIKYLEYCVKTLKNSEKAIHNFLISCYATSRHEGDYGRLLSYLTAQVQSDLDA